MKTSVVVMLTQDENGMAVVLAHEISHALAHQLPEAKAAYVAHK